MKKWVFMFLLLISVAYAHQPRIVDNYFTIVENPEVSKAYYGELNGFPEYFSIKSEKEILLYVNILVPDLEDSRLDFKVDIIKGNKTIYTLDGEFKRYYEEFGGDYYLRGEEYDEFGSGDYYIKVYNLDNKGKYSLAIGKEESFPLKEIINTLIILPQLKKDFFEKSPLTAYSNLIGVFLFIFLVIISYLIIGIIYLIKRYLR